MTVHHELPNPEIDIYYCTYRCPHDWDGTCKPITTPQQKTKIVYQKNLTLVEDPNESVEMREAKNMALNSAPICPVHKIPMIPSIEELVPETVFNTR